MACRLRTACAAGGPAPAPPPSAQGSHAVEDSALSLGLPQPQLPRQHHSSAGGPIGHVAEVTAATALPEVGISACLLPQPLRLPRGHSPGRESGHVSVAKSPFLPHSLPRHPAPPRRPGDCGGWRRLIHGPGPAAGAAPVSRRQRVLQTSSREELVLPWTQSDRAGAAPARTARQAMQRQDQHQLAWTAHARGGHRPVQRRWGRRLGVRPPLVRPGLHEVLAMARPRESGCSWRACAGAWTCASSSAVSPPRQAAPAPGRPAAVAYRLPALSGLCCHLTHTLQSAPSETLRRTEKNRVCVVASSA